MQETLRQMALQWPATVYAEKAYEVGGNRAKEDGHPLPFCLTSEDEVEDGRSVRWEYWPR